MGGHGLPKVPHPRIYKWERIPELVKVQERLAEYGLKDPWLRNEVWRYHPGWGTQTQRVLVPFKGIGVGAALALVFYFGKALYVKMNPDFHHWHDPAYPSDHHHSDDHGEHGHEEAHSAHH